MICCFKKRNGSALIGLLVAVCIIAALVYGSSFFWKNTKGTNGNEGNGSGSAENMIDTLNQAKKDIGNINQATAKQQQAFNEAMGVAGGKITVNNIKPGDTLTSPVLVEGTGQTPDNKLVVELRNQDHQAMVIEPVNIKAAPGEIGPFKINLHFIFSSTKEGFLAVFAQAEDGSQLNPVEIPVKFATSSD